MEYSDTSFIPLKLTKAGKYLIRVKSRDESESVVFKDFSVTVRAPLKNTSRVLSESIILNNDIELSLSSTGGTGEVQYAVYYKKASASKWTKASGYSKDTAASIIPKASADYQIRIYAKDEDGIIVKKEFTVTVRK